MQHNPSLYKQTTGQNRTKLLEMFIYISKIVPQNSQANKSNFELKHLNMAASMFQNSISQNTNVTLRSVFPNPFTIIFLLHGNKCGCLLISHSTHLPLHAESRAEST